MSENIRVDNPDQWLAEHERPPVSEQQIDEVLTWVIELEAQAADIESADHSSAPENRVSRLNAQRDARLSLRILKWVFPDEAGLGPNYFDVRYQAIKDERARAAEESKNYPKPDY